MIMLNNRPVYVGNVRPLIIGENPEPSPTLDEVQIGNQIWKTKNLAIDDGEGGIYTGDVNYGQGDVVEYYYTWGAAVRVANSIEGWHLPTYDEWVTLVNAVGNVPGTKLKSTYGWNSGNGTDDYGFSVFPAGRMRRTNVEYYNERAYFWTATETTSSPYAFNFDISVNVNYTTMNPATFRASIRLIKDAT